MTEHQGTRTYGLAVPLGVIMGVVVANAQGVSTWTLKTDETVLTLTVGSNRVSIAGLTSSGQGWQWVPVSAEVPMPGKDSLKVAGKMTTPNWTYQGATESKTNGHRVVVRFANAEPALELKSYWQALPGPGPIENWVTIVAAAGKTGMQVLLWFGPYNARQDSEIVLQHPEWVTRRWGDGGVGMNKTPARMCTLDLARDEVRDHLVEQISALVKEHRVQWFRDDGKKFRQKCQEMNAWLQAIRNVAPAKDWWPILAAKLRGHYQYYGISGNMPALMRYYSTVLRLTRKWLNRRSQRGKINWRRFTDYLEHYPLPVPRIMHNMYTLARAT